MDSSAQTTVASTHDDAGEEAENALMAVDAEADPSATSATRVPGRKLTPEEKRAKTKQFRERQRKQYRTNKAERKWGQSKDEYLASEHFQKARQHEDVKNRWKKLLKEQVEWGTPTIVIDCSYEDKLREPEVRSLGSQLMQSWGYLKKKEHPLKCYITTYGPVLKKCLDKLQASNWKLYLDERQFVDIPELDRSKLVYLSPDSPNIIQTLDKTHIYIIGGIVDDSRLKGASLNRATALGLPTAALPFQQCLPNYSFQSLNVNHVVNVLMDVSEHGDWAKALLEHTPTRYVMKPQETDGSAATAAATAAVATTEAETPS